MTTPRSGHASRSGACSTSPDLARESRGMAMTMRDVEAVIAELPEVEETEKWHRRTWTVRGKGFAWERPLSKADVKRWEGDPLPQDPILAVATDGLEEKEAVLAAGTRGVFTIAHFNGYPAVLIELAVVP